MPDQTLLDAFAPALADAPPSRVTVGRAIADGRRIVRGRRVAAGSAVFAAVIAIVLLGATVGAGHDHRRPAPAASSPSPVPPTPLRPPIAVYVGNVVTLPSGRTVVLDADPATVGEVIETVDGFVFTTSSDQPGDSAVWFQATGGPAVRVAAADIPVVSPDGHVLVVSDVDNDTYKIVAYELPSRRVLRQVRYTPGSLGAMAGPIRGDWVLIGAFFGGPGPGPAELWNFRTGAVRPLAGADRAWAVDITADGRVFRGMDDAGTKPGTMAARTCFKLAEPSDASGGGVCLTHMGDGIPGEMSLSPDGKWLVMPQTTADGALTVRKVADLTTGGSAVTVRLAGTSPSPGGWLDNTHFLAFTGTGDTQWYECQVTGACRALDLSQIPGDPRVVVTG